MVDDISYKDGKLELEEEDICYASISLYSVSMKVAIALKKETIAKERSGPVVPILKKKTPIIGITIPPTLQTALVNDNPLPLILVSNCSPVSV